jgi:1-pyrroline-5-carboxylate dehydrogenase
MNSSRTFQPLRSATRSLNALPTACANAQVASRRYAGTLANFKVPNINNEPNVRIKGIFFESIAAKVHQQHYAKGSVDRQKLQDAIAALKKRGAVQVPLAIGGEHVWGNKP